MNITGFECFTVELPTRRPHKWVGTNSEKSIGRYLIIKVKTDTDIFGLGEATVVPTWGGDYGCYFGESITTARYVIEKILCPAVNGEDPFRIEFLLSRMDQVVVGYPYAKAAVEMALHDIVGKALGTPVYNLLSGRVRDRVPIAHSIGLMDIQSAVTEAKKAARERVKTIKLKVGQDPDRDVQLVRRVRDVLRPSIKIAVDANQGYSTPKIAIRTIKRMEDYEVTYVEQPVEGIEAMAQVSKSVDTPIMADESAWSQYDVMRIARLQAADLISIYTSKPGGLCRAKKVAAVAEAAGLECNINGSGETGVGNAANLHLAASTVNAKQACVIPVTTLKGREQTQVVGRFYLDDIISDSFKYSDGELCVPNAPGLGIELDEHKMKIYSVADHG